MAAVAVASPAPAACAGADPARLTRIFSRNKYSIPVPRKVSTASRGVLTIGCPFTLKLVFNTISRPVVRPTARSSSWNAALSAAATVCTRADPLTCVMAGSAWRNSGRTSTVTIMYGSSVPGGTSNQRSTSSIVTAGANGRNASRIFTMALMRSRISAPPGSARMLRWPSARGPNSILPRYHATTRPWAISLAACARGGQRLELHRLHPLATRGERGRNLGPPIGRTQERHRQALVPDLPGLRRAPQRRAQRAAVVSRRRLDVDLVEQPRLEQTPVGSTVERHTTREREPALACRRPEVTAHV